MRSTPQLITHKIYTTRIRGQTTALDKPDEHVDQSQPALNCVQNDHIGQHIPAPCDIGCHYDNDNDKTKTMVTQT